uniref:Uncharacterized protein n=1 Tax=viral metagenome TaxID=1070528 RepID=A0A6C0AET5_9ZZZZ
MEKNLILINRDEKLIFDFSPRANCTVISQMFFDSFGMLKTALEYNSWIHEYRGIYSQKNICNLDDLKNTEYLKIKFVRCPYDRAVSIYFFSVSLGYKESFESFLENIINEKITDDRVIYHLQGQFKDYENKVKFNEIVKCENINNRVLFINEKYKKNFKSDLKSSHWYKKHNKNRGEYIGNVEFQKTFTIKIT